MKGAARKLLAEMKLVIGNKNYSSWSLRPWIALRHSGIEFVEEQVRLNFDETEDGSSSNKALFDHSPAGRVPVLVDGDVRVWESLAILEYLAETHPEKLLWPKDRALRAKARVVANEMHAGFGAVRSEMPMNVRRKPSAIDVSAEADRDIARIQQIWSDCRLESASDGPFLFGRFSIADAMYVPVVSRFSVYQIDGSAEVQSYMDSILSLPAYQEWKSDSEAEPWVIAQEER